MTCSGLIKKADYIFKECKFGVFIHWGLYSILGGIWKGKDYPFIGEWIMKRARIPVKEYEKLAEEFNPVNFNADRWVDLVKKSGARYLVFTAKHHDGFAMYNSAVSSFNVVKATPFGKDPLHEISVACKKHGIDLGIYYSHDQDWHDSNGTGNDWDYAPDDQKDLTKYLIEKAEPQIKELFRNYGPISMVWFDTPFKINESQSRRIVSLVRKLQPNCLINGRIGHGLGDYVQQADNEIPVSARNGYWEVPATINNTWGFKHNDNNWKSVDSLLLNFVDVVGKGGNYLLNLGPNADGKIPDESRNRLLAIGEWLKINSSAVRMVEPNPFISEFPWGAVTSSENRLYLHLFNRQDRNLTIYGLKNKITGSFLLGSKSEEKPEVIQKKDANLDFFTTHIFVPSHAHEKLIPVIVLELDSKPEIHRSIFPHGDNSFTLEAFVAEIHGKDSSSLELDERGWFKNWYSENSWLSWKFKVLKPGKYFLSITTCTSREDGDPATPIKWQGGHKLRIELAGVTLTSRIKEDQKIFTTRETYFPQIITNFGKIELKQPGMYELRLIPEYINSANDHGLSFRSVKLTPVSHGQNKILDNFERHKIKHQKSANLV